MEFSSCKIVTETAFQFEFQIDKYKANAQPYYVLIDHEGNNLNEYSAYNPDIEAYLVWLQEGIENFKE